MAMPLDAARVLVGSQPATCLKNMRRALELHPWSNTRADWARLEAAYVVLRVPHGKRLRTREADDTFRGG